MNGIYTETLFLHTRQKHFANFKYVFILKRKQKKDCLFEKISINLEEKHCKSCHPIISNVVYLHVPIICLYSTCKYCHTCLGYSKNELLVIYKYSFFNYIN